MAASTSRGTRPGSSGPGQLAAALAAIVAALEAEPCPNSVADVSHPADTVKNPFA